MTDNERALLLALADRVDDLQSDVGSWAIPNRVRELAKAVRAEALDELASTAQETGQYESAVNPLVKTCDNCDFGTGAWCDNPDQSCVNHTTRGKWQPTLWQPRK